MAPLGTTARAFLFIVVLEFSVCVCVRLLSVLVFNSSVGRSFSMSLVYLMSGTTFSSLCLVPFLNVKSGLVMTSTQVYTLL